MSDTDHATLVAISEIVEAFDEEMARELLECFLGDTNDVVDRIAAAARASEFEEARRAAHILTGCCRSVSACTAEKVSRRVEDAARAGEGDQVIAHLEELRRVYGATRREIEHYLNSGG